MSVCSVKPQMLHGRVGTYPNFLQCCHSSLMSHSLMSCCIRFAECVSKVKCWGYLHHWFSQLWYQCKFFVHAGVWWWRQPSFGLGRANEAVLRAFLGGDGWDVRLACKLRRLIGSFGTGTWLWWSVMLLWCARYVLICMRAVHRACARRYPGCGVPQQRPTITTSCV